jgi:release factor glutamine methyltransferase
MELTEFLESVESSYPSVSRDDTERIISEVLRIPRLEISLYGEKHLTKSEITEIDMMLFKRAENEPLQYIFGETQFRNLNLLVGEGVLIPRPETEVLVDLALTLLKDSSDPEICDIGTGSGAIALAIGSERPDSKIKAIDISKDALKFAEKNKLKNKIGNVDFIYGDLLSPFENIDPPRQFNLITANLPYVASPLFNSLPSEVKDYEPETALLSGEDGLDHISKTAKSAKKHLLSAGHIIFEFSPEQKESIMELLKKEDYSEIEIENDLNGLARFAIGKKN